MSKIIVRRQEYANNGTHANEIEAVVKDNLIVNTLSSAMDVAPSVGLLKSVKDEADGKVIYDTFSYTFTSATNQRTININTAKTGYKTVAVSFIHNDDLYYVAANDGIYPQLSILENGNVQIMGLNKALATTANRTLKVICVYIKN